MKIDEFGIPVSEDKTEEVLFKNKWIEVYEKDGWYTCYRSEHGVVVLGIRYSESKKALLDEMEALVRVEHTPCHLDGPKEGKFNLTSLTGMIEDGLTPFQTAKKELLEESGYDVQEEAFIDLGWVYPSKQSDNKIYLFAVDLTGLEPSKEISGDGTKGEEGAYSKWVSLKEAISLPSPMIGACISRLFAGEL